ncbi:MAG: response regulator [Lachnospiraceae bacterium]|nr:response regulator [Lachnospiraceae bacterium]
MAVTIFSAVMCFLSVIMLYLARITGEEEYYSKVICFVLNFLLLPLFFFISGDIYNGTALFFVLGIIITVFLNSKSKYIYPVVCLELAVDVFTVWFAFYKRDWLVIPRTYVDIVGSITVSFVLVAITVVFVCLYQAFIYRITKENINSGNRSISVAESSKTRFLANMTHEIRTPMNAIIGMTSLILKEKLSPEVKDQVNTINYASTQLLRIINDILEYSKLDSGKVELIKSQFSFRELIKEIIDSVAKEYEKDSIKFITFVDKNIPDILFGDDIRIKQVFKYLLFSALSQTENGTVILKIGSEENIIDRTVAINVELAITGAGFSDAEMDSIFNAYSNYDSRQKSNFKGMGIELNICKQLLNMMGGDLNVRSIEGIGTAVVFSFESYIVSDDKIVTIENDTEIRPLLFLEERQFEEYWQYLFRNLNISATYTRNISMLKKQLENVRFTHIFVLFNSYEKVKAIFEAFECLDKVYVITEHSAAYGDYDDCKILRLPVSCINISDVLNNTWKAEDYQVVKKKERYTYPYAKVLLVDDSLINIKVEESLLANYEIESRFANSGYEALDILKREKFDLVLLDQKMPEFDGIDTIHALRSSDYISSSIPVICVTAEFGNDVRDRLIAEGFDDYVSKPISINYLEQIFEKYLPEELRVIIEESEPEKETKQVAVNDLKVENPEEITSFDPEIGIANLGGNVDAYISVLQTYYKEGILKQVSVPEMLNNGDISLYTTDVHALKSSSATVGAMGISPLFKELEFAGRDNNIDFIKENTAKTLEYFVTVLDKVKEYLISEDALEEDEDVSEYDDNAETVALDADLLNELSSSIMVMNLRRCEEIIDELSKNNYGKDVNAKVKEIKESYDNFDYMAVKDIALSLLA